VLLNLQYGVTVKLILRNFNRKILVRGLRGPYRGINDVLERIESLAGI